MDTIFALATARGRAGVAVIRVSGSCSFAAAKQIAGSLPEAGSARLRRFRTPDGDEIDEGLLIVFPHGRSFTGEDVAEFQVHGSIAVVDALLKALGDIEGLRPAEPGEFTRRAFLYGRMDLAQVEGLAALIDAETEVQRKLAQRAFDGALGKNVERWRAKLIEAAALIEATIDFADEDVPEDVLPEVFTNLVDVQTELRLELEGIPVAERVRDGFEVAIVGAPNAGKSTLLNRIAKRDVAMTSDIPGTTRDTLEVRLNLDGLPVTLIDTAGMRETDDELEAIGVSRGKRRAEKADLRVFLVADGQAIENVTKHPDDIVVEAKDDNGILGQTSISGVSGHGVAGLIQRISDVLSDRISTVGVASTERQAGAIRIAISNVEDAMDDLKRGEDSYDVAAEKLRVATSSLSVLIGRVDVEDLLDHIFSSFCIGK